MSESPSGDRSGADADAPVPTPSSPTDPNGNPAPPVYGAPVHETSATVMNPPEERNWAVGAHLSSFAAAYVALGFIGPLVVLLAAGNRSAFVRRHAVAALNFNLSLLLYAVASGILVLILIGIPMLIALALLYLVATIQGALAASQGLEYRYPLTIRFIS